MSGISNEIEDMFIGGDQVGEHLQTNYKYYAAGAVGIVIGMIVLLLLLAFALWIYKWVSCDDSEPSEFAGSAGRHIRNKIDPSRMKILETQNGLDAPYGSAQILDPSCVRKEMVDYRNKNIDNFEPNVYDSMGHMYGFTGSEPCKEEEGPRSVKAPIYNEGYFVNQAPQAIGMNLLYSGK